MPVYNISFGDITFCPFSRDTMLPSWHTAKLVPVKPIQWELLIPHYLKTRKCTGYVHFSAYLPWGIFANAIDHVQNCPAVHVTNI